MTKDDYRAWVDGERKRELQSQPSSAAAGYALVETRIEMAGVMRCCLATVAEEYQGQDGPAGDQRVTLGMKSQCRHCKETFTLVEAKPHPKWKPDWQIDGHNY